LISWLISTLMAAPERGLAAHEILVHRPVPYRKAPLAQNTSGQAHHCRDLFAQFRMQTFTGTYSVVKYPRL